MPAIVTPTLIQPQEVINGGLLKATPLNARFDSMLLAPHIRLAEERFVLPVLCKPFYDDLIMKKEGRISNYNTAISANAAAFPSAGDTHLETLWRERLLELCSWAVFCQSLPHIVNQVGSNSAFQPQFEHGKTLDVAGLKFMQNDAIDTINLLQKKLIDWLCEHRDDYQLFCANEKCGDGCAPCGAKVTTNEVALARLGLYIY